MGSSPSLPQAQCPVQPVHQAQIPIRCQRCDCPKVKWKCDQCVLLMCDKCGREDHAVKGHHIIDITTSQVKISDVKEYQDKDFYIKFLAVAHDNSLWIGNGIKEKGFITYDALQNVKLVGDKAKVKSSFNLSIFDIAVTPNNDILLVTEEPKLKQIKAGSNKVTDSIYCMEKSFKYKSVHVTKVGKVIVGGDSVVVVMDTDGRHLTRYEKDENNKIIFPYEISCLTSTTNGNIFAACTSDTKVVVLGQTEIISIYRGHPTVNDEYNKFYPSSLVTTPMDNVIVADSENHSLHILDNTGHLLTTYNTADIGLTPLHKLAILTEGSFTYMTSIGCELYKMVITGC